MNNKIRKYLFGKYIIWFEGRNMDVGFTSSKKTLLVVCLVPPWSANGDFGLCHFLQAAFWLLLAKRMKGLCLVAVLKY